MSWSVTTTGRDPEEIKQNLIKLQETNHIPDRVIEAVDDAVCAFGAKPEVEREMYVSTNGHVADGQGSCSISINITNKPVDATKMEGARELADRLKG